MSSTGYKHTPEARAKISAAATGKKPRWRGGRFRRCDGYVFVFSPDHPYANGRGYVLEHRLVMETHLGRVLLPTEIVHHINGTKDDNCIENLGRFNSQADHTTHHRAGRKK